jgi:hypothetical protein
VGRKAETGTLLDDGRMWGGCHDGEPALSPSANRGSGAHLPQRRLRS